MQSVPWRMPRSISIHERGRQIARTDPLGRAHSTIYDSAGRVVAEISPSGRKTEYSYDSSDQRIAITVGVGTSDAASMDFTYHLRRRRAALIGERGGLNLYAMVGNDLLNRIDFLGLKSVLPHCDEASKDQDDDCPKFTRIGMAGDNATAWRKRMSARAAKWDRHDEKYGSLIKQVAGGDYAYAPHPELWAN